MRWLYKMTVLGSLVFAIIFSVIFIIFLFRYWNLLQSTPTKFRALLFSFRTITICFLLFLLIDPWISINKKERSPQEVDVIFDLSESMNVHFDNIDIRQEHLKTRIDTWSDKYGIDIDHYRLGNKITSLTAMDASDLMTDFTNLPNFMTYKHPDQIILITDGKTPL